RGECGPQRWPRIQYCRRNRLQPVQYRGDGAAKMQWHPLSFYQPFGAVKIAGGGGMVKSFELEPVVSEPGAGATMQVGNCQHLIRCGGPGNLMQSLAQQISEEMMIAVPTPLVVQRDNEQVGVLDVFQQILAGPRRRQQHGIAQWAAHALK